MQSNTADKNQPFMAKSWDTHLNDNVTVHLKYYIGNVFVSLL